MFMVVTLKHRMVSKRSTQCCLYCYIIIFADGDAKCDLICGNLTSENVWLNGTLHFPGVLLTQ